MKTGIGADGVVVLDKDAAMDSLIFNADGSEAEMCGNGARCAAAFLDQGIAGKTMCFRTLAGVIEGRINGSDAAIKMTDPSGLRTGITIRVGARKRTVHFINTGINRHLLSRNILKMNLWMSWDK